MFNKTAGVAGLAATLLTIPGSYPHEYGYRDDFNMSNRGKPSLVPTNKRAKVKAARKANRKRKRSA